MDGTFRVSPDLFFQLYTIHGEVMGEMMPLVFCFLPDKRQITYERMFTLIINACLQHGLHLEPDVIQVDFERAAIQASENVLPLATIRGCMFHYGQAVWRKVQELGLQRPYTEDEGYRRWIRRASALPMVFLNEMNNAWRLVVQSAPGDAVARVAFHVYLWETWVDPTNAKFQRHLWNHAGNPGPRTINHLEGWHSGIGRNINRSHPSFARAVELLKSEQARTELRRQLALGHAPGRRNAAYDRVNQRIERVRRRFQEGDIDLAQYMDTIGHLLGKRSLRD